MKYTVVWLPEAEDELTNLWLNASDREAIRRASDTVDRTLRNDPENCGESRGLLFRILLEQPLAVKYAISAADRRVLVVQVWMY